MWNNNYIKGTVYPKIKIPNLCGFLFLRGIQKKILKNFGNKTILVTIVWLKNTQTFIKISSFVSHSRKIS